MNPHQSLLFALALLAAGPASSDGVARVETPAESRAAESWKPCGRTPVLLQDIRPGAEGSEPRELVHGDRVLFFTADDGAHGRELWKSSGTGGAGTFLVKDILPGSLSSEPAGLTVWRGRLFFIADDGVHGRELWVSDGTASGTHMVKGISPGDSGFPPGTLLATKEAVYFSAYDKAHGTELWRTDGTAAGTVLARDILPGPRSSYPGPLAEGPDGALYYAAYLELSSSRSLIKEFAGGPPLVLDAEGSGYFYALTWLGDVLFYFRHADGPLVWLSRTESTRESTRVLREFYYEDIGGPEALVRLGDRLYFGTGANDLGLGFELWRTDGTLQGTRLLRDLQPGPGSSNPSGLGVLGRRLFFAADDGSTKGRELWVSDGTASGTRLFKDLDPRGSSSPGELTFIQGWLFFTAETAGRGRELWVSNGTGAGTVPLDEIAPGPTSAFSPAQPTPFVRSGWDVFLVANDGEHGLEPWALPFRPADACDG